MAPITRSSLHGARSQLQELQQTIEPDSDSFDGDDHDEDLMSDQDDANFPFQTSTQEMLQPLQDTADRVSKQVEEFAKCLDKFNMERGFDDQGLWEDAWQLLDKYSQIARSRYTQTASRSPRSSANRRSLGDTEVQLQKVQLETHLWTLTQNLLKCSSPKSKADATTSQVTDLKELNRYSTNTQIWNAFLDSDNIAQEYECCLDWLQERAVETLPSIEETISDLTQQSERGENSWSSVALFTRDAIKKQKRARTWSMPLDPSNPGSGPILRRSNDGAPLISQFDPDSQSREDAKLEPQDEMHEQAAWQACWEMLRRGRTVNDIRDWWIARNEQWRSTAISPSDPNSRQSADSPWSRIINLASNPEFTSRCKMLCQGTTIEDEYQKAIYGVLCGNVSAPREVCKNIDDDLFTIFNSLLIDRFQQYLTAYKQKLIDSSLNQYHPQITTNGTLKQYLSFAQADDNMREEAHEPHKYIEMAVLAKDFENMFLQVGQAAAQIAHSSGGEFSHLMAKIEDESSSDCAQVTAQDEDSVRIIAHLQLLLRSLGFLEQAYTQDLYLMENNIANYIGWLQKSKKWSLIPLYASKLSSDRTTRVLGAILNDLREQKERDLQVRLMKHYKINISEVIYGIFYLTNYADIHRFKDNRCRFTAPRITEREEGKAKQTKIRSAFMGGDPSPEEETTISSLEWYSYVSAEEWGKACWSVSLIYKLYLSEGKFGALRDLARRVNLGYVSLKAFSMNLQFADESEDVDREEMDVDGMDEERPEPASPNRRKKNQKSIHPLRKPGTSREVLHSKSLVWLQLEQLVFALDALERWQDWADDIDANRSNVAQLRSMKQSLRQSLEEVRMAMQPLLDRDFLCRPIDDREAATLKEIRNHYIPECILGYNSVLYFAGHAISRSWLVECMQLAQVVAQTPMLTDAFVESGRMRELVSAFALDSQALLHANEQGASKTKKGKKENGTDIWQVSWKDQGPIDLEALD